MPTLAFVISLTSLVIAACTAAIQSGHAVTCLGEDHAYRVYRFFKGNPNEIRWYPNKEIADSWDDNWEKWKQPIVCTYVKRGADMTKAPEEGKAVKCENDPHPERVYRFSKLGIRWYPSEAVANSLDPNWTQFVTIDCRGSPQQVPMVSFPNMWSDIISH